MMTHEQLKQKALSRQGVKTHYDGLKEEFEFIRKIIYARKDAGLTQADVAKRMGTTRSAISRLEGGQWDIKHSPSIRTLERYAEAIGRRLVLDLE